MKHRSMTLLVSLVLAAGLLGVLPAPRALAATCNSTKTGNWNDTTVWSCSAIPGANDDVFVQSGHTVSLTQVESVKDLSVNTGGVVSIGANTLQVHGKLRAFTGAAPGTDSNSPGANCITSTGAGKLSIVGNSRAITVSGQWAATTTGYAQEVNLNSGQTVTMGTNMKAASWNIAAGTLDTGSFRVAADNGTSGGPTTIAAGASVNSGASGSSNPIFYRTGTTSGGALTVNGSLLLTGGSPNIAMSSIAFNGTVEYGASGNQTLAVATDNGADPTTYANLKLSGSGTKTLGLNTTVNGTLTRAGTASLGLGTFVLTYGSSTVLEYAGSGAQTTADTEFPASGGPNSLTINNVAGVSLNGSRTVNGTLTLTSGRLSLGNNTLTLGASATVGGTPDASKMVVTDVDGSQTGKLCKVWGSGAFTYPIGDNRGTAEYSPVTFTPTSPSGLTVCFRAVDEAHPNKPTTPTTDYLTRYWSGTTSAGSFTGYTGVFTFINDSSDVVGSTTSMLPKRWTGAFPWEEQNNAISGATFTWNGGAALSDFTAFKSGILAVTLAEFFAQQVSDHVLVTWETASELGNLGFNLYRGVSPAGPDRRLNDLLIPSQSVGNPGGFVYTWEDAADLVAGTTYYYWVEDVDINGAATRHGPVSVDYVAPTAVTLSGVQASPAAPAALPLVGTLLALLTPLAAAGLRRRA